MHEWEAVNCQNATGHCDRAEVRPAEVLVADAGIIHAATGPFPLSV